MSIVLVGSTSGSITLQEQAVSGSTVLDLPATSGNVVVDSATQTLTNKTLTSPVISSITNTGTLTLPTTTGTLALTSQITSAGVIQVKSTAKTDSFSTGASSYTDITGLSVSITPTSASNKILVMMTLTCGNDTATVFMPVRLMRDSTAIDIGNAAGSRTQASGGSGRVNDVSDTYSLNAIFLDSPGTTSAITYKVQIFANSGTSFVGSNGLNADNPATGRYPSTITVMEVTP